MLKERYTLRCAVFLILTKVVDGKEYVLLQQRFHTGILDGKYDVSCSGHLEADESVTEAMIRETKEEIGIEVAPTDLSCCSLIHASFADAQYLLVVFHANHYQGIPTIKEPEKCNDLSWFPMDQLPENIAETRKIMLENYQNHNFYSEYGFVKQEIMK